MSQEKKSRRAFLGVSALVSNLGKIACLQKKCVTFDPAGEKLFRSRGDALKE